MTEQHNGPETHGYRWRDGTIHDMPEPMHSNVQEEAIVKYGVNPRDIDRDTYNKAYAEWVREFTAWKIAMREWTAKYGSKK